MPTWPAHRTWRPLRPWLIALLASLLVACPTARDPDQVPDAAADATDGGRRIQDGLDDLSTTEDAALPDDAAVPDDTPDIAEVDAGPVVPERMVDLVRPLVATGGIGFGVGSGVPGPKAPFGMIHPSPDGTGEMGIPPYHCGGYHASDDTILGFSQTHLYGVGIPDYGFIPLMPTAGPLDASMTAEGAYASAFAKEDEEAHPAYYGVTLADHGVLAELTATTRAAHHRYTFPPGVPAGERLVVMDLAHAAPDCSVSDGALVVSEGGAALEGWVRGVGGFTGRYGGLPVYFVARFDRPPQAWATWAGEDFGPGVGAREGADTGALLAFDGAEVVEVQIAISFVDVDGARANLDAEMPAWDFDGTRQATEDAWEQELSVVRVEGGTPDERSILATALYHAFMMPNVFTDTDGAYRGFDKEVHQAEGFVYYSDFSMWDTYRTEHPLLALLQPARARDMMVSLLTMAEQGGGLPKWPQGIGYTGCMVGSPAHIVLADAYLRGVTGFDAHAALAQMAIEASGQLPPGTSAPRRSGIEAYLAKGYVDIEASGGSVARTMEYAIADFAISRLAEALGEYDQAALFGPRGANYRNLWDAETAFFRGRHADGSWADLDPLVWESYYTEGTAWQYLWLAPHDIDGLVDLFGSPEALVAKLETFFDEGRAELEYRRAHVEDEPVLQVLPPEYYWHGNEPDIHAAYIFARAGRPELTQRWVRWIAETLYGTGPDGIAGNDDCGTLSAWYVWSAMGLYPIAGDDLYLVGAPLFPHIEADLADGTLVVDAPGASAANPYVQSVTVDGAPLDEPWFRHALISGGATLVFEMGPEPSAWGRPE